MEGIRIIIPVYNVEKYLYKCLDSVCAQADCVREIILINDGSTDGSLDICKRYAENDARIKIIEQENKGLSATVRVGVRAATCDYIGFVDSDDYIEKEMYARMYEEMKKHNADVVWCEYDRVGESGNNLSKSLEDDGSIYVYEKQDGRFPIRVYPLFFAADKEISGSRCNKLIKRELIVKNIAFEDLGISFGEDLALIAPIMFTAEKIVNIRKYYYHYLQRGTSIVHTYNRKCFDDYIKVIDIIDRARKLYCYEMADFDEFKIKLLFAQCISKIRISNLKFKQRKKELKFLGSDPLVRELLKKIKVTGSVRLKIIMKLLKWKWYSALAFIINKGVKK